MSWRSCGARDRALPEAKPPVRPAAQRAAGAARRRDLVVRLVRFNAGQRGVGGQRRRLRAGEHPARRVYRDARLDGHRMVAAAASHRASASPLVPSRAGGDHPGVGLRAAWAAIIIGAAAGLLCYVAVHLKDMLPLRRLLDVVGVHMVGGAIGVVLTGVFASLAVNAAGEAGRLDSARPPGSAGGRRNRLPVRHDLDHPVGHRPDRGAAGESGGRASRRSISASTPRSPTSGRRSGDRHERATA